MLLWNIVGFLLSLNFCPASMDNDDDDNTIMMIASFVAQMLQSVDRFYIKDPQVLDITGEQ